MWKAPWLRVASLRAFKLGEAALAALVYVAAVHLVEPRTAMGSTDATTWTVGDVAFVTAIVVCWHALLLGKQLYASRRLDRGMSREAVDILTIVSALTCLVATAGVFGHPSIVHPSFLIAFWTGLAGATLIERLLLRKLLGNLRIHGRNLRFGLIVGNGPRAQQLAHTLASRPELGVRLVGWVDEVETPAHTLRMGSSYLGDLDELPRILSRTVVDAVFVMLPMRSRYECIQKAVLDCEEQGVPVILPTDFFAVRLSRMREEHIDELPVVCLSSLPESDWRIAAKRALDVSGAVMLLVLLSPLMLATAVAVRLTSPGPVIFRQARTGLNKRPFTMYKFRTMIADAEARQAALGGLNEVSGPVFKICNDPRLTPVGAFLRRTSLDELPQLLNVLIGNMSLVGPRPLPLRDVEGFREDWQRRRFSVRPGITCLWQLSGRSNVSFERWMEMDLQYIDQWSLRLDLRILLKTVGAVLRREGAY